MVRLQDMQKKILAFLLIIVILFMLFCNDSIKEGYAKHASSPIQHPIQHPVTFLSNYVSKIEMPPPLPSPAHAAVFDAIKKIPTKHKIDNYGAQLNKILTTPPPPLENQITL